MLYLQIPNYYILFFKFSLQRKGIKQNEIIYFISNFYFWK